MKVQSLGSGSSGNAWLLEGSGTAVLVDCGFPPRTLARKLAEAGIAPERIHGVVLTHEHDDHARGLAGAVARWGWPVHTHPASARRLPAEVAVVARPWTPEAPATIGALQVAAVRVPHDAAASQAAIVTDTRSGWRTGLAHDLGEVPAALVTAFDRLDLLVLEANHDLARLRAGPYPRWLQDRVAGALGHLSNAQAAALARAVAHRGLREVVLAHLSEENNRPALAVEAVRGAMAGTGFRGRVHAARHRAVGAPCGDGGSGSQLALAL